MIAIRYFAGSLLILVVCFCCTPPKPVNKFSDATLRSIADLGDRREKDSLVLFFQSPVAEQRKAAILAFASIQDSTISTQLGTALLNDPSVEVRECAAFALGQTGGTVSVASLEAALRQSPSESRVVSNVLEALGRAINAGSLSILENYRPNDSITEAGLARAYLRLAQRRIGDSIVARKMSVYLEIKRDKSLRILAAEYFNRAPQTNAGFQRDLIHAALIDPDVEVRINAAAALRKIKTDSVLVAIGLILDREKDYRVRVSAVRALQPFPITLTRKLFSKALRDQHAQVGVAAAELIQAVVTVPDSLLMTELKVASNGRIRASLFASMLSVKQQPTEVLKILMHDYAQAKDDYTRAQLLSALSGTPDVSTFVYGQLIGTRSAVVKTSAAGTLVAMNQSKDFAKARTAAFLEYYRGAINDGDAGVIGIVAGALGDSTLGYRPLLRDLTFLINARHQLHLPKDIESLQPLDDAIAYLEGKEKPLPLKNGFNHPINWKLAMSIPADQKVLIRTSKGDIEMRLFVDQAPGSVVNFVELVNKKYYDGRFFHRVVPNFVLQTGCNRGDGFGSEDYSIRSEFSMRMYKTGSVGYASAGKDTEGTQWFITHSPTPHLDGRYSIFAEVIDGMDVADKIEVGDQIKSVSLVDN